MASATPYTKDGRFLVSKTPISGGLKSDIKRAVDLIGGFEEVIEDGDTVTIKPNFNTADPYPASSDPEFVKALGELLLEAGAEKIRIVDSSTLRVSTREVARKIGFNEVADALDAELIFLDENEWVKVDFPRGKFLKEGSIGKPLLDLGKLVLAPCLKTHKLARFTASMKLFVGWIKRKERLRMHARRLEQKAVDLASYFHPSLIVMDARKCFVTGGPMSGQLECSGFILASGDMVSIDVEGVKILQSYGTKNRLDRNVWELPQIAHAVEIGIGAKSDAEIELVVN
ncbi:MAG: DUF362 domain-containing protein [Candidatus Thorarchaeota archaeon]